MRPYLRRGNPVGQRHVAPKPIALVLCTCDECRQDNMAFDPRLGRLVPGRLVGRQMANFHRRHGGSVPPPRDDDIPVDQSATPIDGNPLANEQYVPTELA